MTHASVLGDAVVHVQRNMQQLASQGNMQTFCLSTVFHIYTSVGGL